MAKLETKPISAAEIARRISEAPTVVAAQGRLDRVQARLRAAEGDAKEILAKMSMATEQKAVDKATALLHDDSENEASMEPLQAEYSRLRDAAELLAKAVRLGETELDFARRSTGASILKELQPELQERQRALIATYAACAVESLQYAEFVRSLRIAGIELTPDHIFGGNINTGASRNSSFYTWSESLIERGLLSWDDVPEALRKSWGVNR